MSSNLAESLAAPPQAPARRPVPAVAIEGVSKRFGDVMALEEAWLSIAPGEFMTLLGPSGCGKTTLLNLVAGFIEADGGEMFIDGSYVTATPPHKREIGIVFQNYALFPHMTVEKNVGYGLKMRGVPKAEIAERVRAALALVKLDGYGDRKPRQLSGGQQQRVALARALVIRPKVLLLDEPFSALDKNLRGSMQVELKEIQKSLGVSTIFVTHDQSEALSMSDRIAVMSQGRIRQIGTPDEVYCHPTDRFVASFVGDTNVLGGRLVRQSGNRALVEVSGVEVEVGSSGLESVGQGAPIDLFVRPEHVAIPGTGTPATVSGTVATHVYQGAHVDLYIDSPAARSGRILMRSPGKEAMTRWPVGAPVGFTVPQGTAFAAEPA